MNESHFKILRTYAGKFDCLVFEMLNIMKFKANLNVQTESILGNLYVQLIIIVIVVIVYCSSQYL